VAVNELPALFKRAQEILQCTCDQACHHCLLNFDTQHQMDSLDRRRALDFLTPGFFLGLQLPDAMRLLGPDTRYEFEPPAKALRREMQRLDSEEIRLYPGGDSQAWDLLEWPLKPDLLRWSAEGNTVSLVLAESVELDTVLSNQLAALVEIAGCRVYRARAPALPGGALLAEVGGGARHARWAVVEADAAAPGPDWGRSGGAAHAVIKRVEAKPLPAIAGRELTVADLRRAPPGNVLELQIRNELDGPVADFGARFWRMLADAQPSLRARFKSGGALKEIHYTDRYLKSPLVVKLLGQVIFALADMEHVVNSDTQLIIRTAEIEPKPNTPQRIEHDWQRDMARNKVAELFFQQDFAGRVEVDSRHYRQLPHARELCLIWQEGTQFIVRLDQGMGYWGTLNPVEFKFAGTPSIQAQHLTTANFAIQAREARHPTILYVSK
jgi:hypothetical protein